MSATATESTVKVKKPFNKAAWREKKYSHGHKVEQWRDKHKLAMTRNYRKMVRKEEKRSQFHARGEQADSNPNLEPIGEKQSFTNKNDDKKTNYGFNKAKRKFDDKLAIKEKKQLEIQRRQKEKEAAIKKYKEKKAVKMKALTAKTKRGQPVMAGRIELLLEQIQEQCKGD